jgi:hypothetical protein
MYTDMAPLVFVMNCRHIVEVDLRVNVADLLDGYGDGRLPYLTNFLDSRYPKHGR